MKKSSIIAALFLLAACSSGGSKKTAKSAWPEDQQKAFMENCTNTAQNGMDPDQAQKYCDCMLQKMMDKYPDVNDAGNINIDEMTDMASGCLDQ